MMALLAPMLAEALTVSVALATASLTGWVLVFSVHFVRRGLE